MARALELKQNNFTAVKIKLGPPLNHENIKEEATSVCIPYVSPASQQKSNVPLLPPVVKYSNTQSLPSLQPENSSTSLLS